jgi:hypothetical protein
VPPAQCPECGRFLRRTLVAALGDDGAPCPRCGTALRPTMFDDLEDDAPATAPTYEVTSVRPPDLGPATATTVDGDDPRSVATSDRDSVRPPDLPPVTVRDEPRDVLAGWDVGVDRQLLDRWRQDRAPFPWDATLVVVGGLAGAAVGALAADRRGRGALWGGLGGLVGAAIARRIWQLDT